MPFENSARPPCPFGNAEDSHVQVGRVRAPASRGLRRAAPARRLDEAERRDPSTRAARLAPLRHEAGEVVTVPRKVSIIIFQSVIVTDRIRISRVIADHHGSSTSIRFAVRNGRSPGSRPPITEVFDAEAAGNEARVQAADAHVPLQVVARGALARPRSAGPRSIESVTMSMTARMAGRSARARGAAQAPPKPAWSCRDLTVPGDRLFTDYPTMTRSFPASTGILHWPGRPDPAAARPREFVFHLHRLDNHQRLARRDSVAGSHENADDATGHRRNDPLLALGRRRR